MMQSSFSLSRIFKLLAAAALGCLLAACGGGGGGGTASASAPSSVTAMQAGFFSSALAQTPVYPETISILTTDHRWWAVRRDSSSSASIFSGALIQDGLGAGSVASLKAFAGGRVRSGSAAMTLVSEQGLTGRISLVADPTATPPLSASTLDVAVSKPSAAAYSASRVANVSALSGDWSGTWIDGANSALVTLNFNAGVVSLPAGTSVLNCRLTSASTVTAEAGANLYRIDLAFQPGLTTCTRSDQLEVRIFSGVLLVYSLPDLRQRLDLLAVDASGSGIVFRAER